MVQQPALGVSIKKCHDEIDRLHEYVIQRLGMQEQAIQKCRRMMINSKKRVGVKSSFNNHKEKSTQTGIPANNKLKAHYKTLYSTARVEHSLSAEKKMHWKNFHNLRIVNEFIDGLSQDYPSICTVYNIGKSVEGRPIKVIKISNSNVGNDPIWIDGGIHAREWISTAAATYLADLLVKNFKNLPSYITNKDWHIAPLLNPDGYNFTQRTRITWRKNRARRGKFFYGVDLNRNFSYQWGMGSEKGDKKDPGSSSNPRHSMYRGDEPFSEPESCAVRDYILDSPIPFKSFISFHSAAKAITMPWSHSQEPCPDYERLKDGAQAMADAIYQVTGSLYRVGTFHEILYCATGTSLDWSYGELKIPYSYLVELKGGAQPFPWMDIEETCEEAVAAVEALVEHIDTCEAKLDEVNNSERLVIRN